MQGKSLLLYDFLSVKGGAESVSLKICKHYERFDACFGFIDNSVFPGVTNDFPSQIKTLCQPTRIPGWQTLKVAHAFESHRGLTHGYGNVIYSGSNAPLAVHHQRSGNRIYYCHTPPRFIYDLKEHYLNTVALWQKPLLKALIKLYQPKYENAINQMDVIIANSQNVRNRIKHYLGRDAEVIYPPCETSGYRWKGQSDYYLSTARLEPYKRVDLIVKAFKQMPEKKLIVASGGSQFEELKNLANGAPNITFTGWCSSDHLRDLVGNCIATIYIPIDEDFGMSPVESMASGKPVIVVKQGGLQETVISSVTGFYCSPNLNCEELKTIVRDLSKRKAREMRDDCEKQANHFSEQNFFNSLNKHLQT